MKGKLREYLKYVFSNLKGKEMKKLLILFSILTLISIPVTVKAQLIGGHQNPPGINWKNIRTPHFDLIFPEELTEDAQRVANTLEHLYSPLVKTLHPGTVKKRWPVMLTNQGVASNGYVMVAPRKSEWFHLPPQYWNGPAGEWYSLLSVHETRHMIMFDKFNRRFSRIAWILYGESGVGFLSSVAVPAWFWEGDAVAMETALTDSGRGRSPEFDMGIRANLLSGRRYSYYKASLGSYRDYFPNHYKLGYLMVTHVRRRYGASAWDNIIDRTTLFSLSPFRFSGSLKKETGKNVRQIYDETMDEMETLWKEQLDQVTITEARTVNTARKKVWTNYQYAQYTDDDSLIALKRGKADTPVLVRLYPDGREKKIISIKPLDHISYGGGKIAWAELSTDPRWLSRQYAVIVIYDLSAHKKRQITKKTKLYAPALSPDGLLVAAVEYTSERVCSLVILDAESGAEVKRFPNPDNDFIMQPSWSQDGKRIVFKRQNMKGEALTVVDVESKAGEDIIPESWEGIDSPRFYRNFILYSSPYSGIDNIYAIDIGSGRQYQVTSRKYGAYGPAVSKDGAKLAFQDYTADGSNVAETDIDPSSWVGLEEIEDLVIRYYEPLIEQEQGKSILKEEDVPNVQYDVEDYKPFKHLVNIHSWSFFPIWPDPDLNAASSKYTSGTSEPFLQRSGTKLGIKIVSNDLLNTARIKAGLAFNRNERVFGGGFNISYAGLLPVIDLGASYGGRAQDYKKNGSYTRYSWTETTGMIGLRVPLNFSNGVYDSSIQIGANTEYVNITGKQAPYVAGEPGNGYLMPLTYSLEYWRRGPASQRDLYPRWAQGFTGSFSHTPLPGDYRGLLLSTQAAFYFPGLFKHHSFYLQGGFEWQQEDNYRFTSKIPFPRGYDYVFHDKLYKASANYAMPLFYPDIALGAIVYWKRVYTTIFYDFGMGSSSTNDPSYYQSAGFDLEIEFNLFTIPVPLTGGARFVYRINDNEIRLTPLILGAELVF